MAIRGLSKENEVAPRLLLRDTRTLGMKIADFFKDPVNSAITIASFAAATYLIPSFSDLICIIGILIFVYAYTRRATLPFRIPKRSKIYDYNDPKPGSTEPCLARGTSFFGNDLNGDELWFNNEDMRTHVLMFGSTGSGKTEALVSISFNALVQGSGFLYVDGKGDNSLFAKIFSLCRIMGREDDLLLINFMTGARDVVGAQEKRLSNTMNPFCNGSSSMLSQLVVSLMDAGSQSADGDMWKGRAIVFVEALMKVLVYMRDQGKILLDANTIRNYFELHRVESIAIDKIFPRDNEEPLSLVDAPDLILDPIKNYVVNLPGYDRSKKGKQTGQVLEQHGFITMQLTRVFGSLADTYGHIIRTNLAEVDLKDVVLNRRILVVLLPALEKSPDELSGLGKVIIASLKAMMAAGLGDSVEGSYHEVITRKPTHAATSYLCILDEYGYYAVKGFAVVPAQARSLGFSVIFAGQDLPAFQKASKEEAASIGANTNIKICMKLEDPLETWDFFQKTAGESYVTKVDSFQTTAGSLLNNYMDSRSASADKWQRVNLLDLKEQREGEAHIFFRSRIVRAKIFFANPPPAKRMRINQFLKVASPTGRSLLDLEDRIVQFEKVLANKVVFASPREDSEEIPFIADFINKQPMVNSIEVSLAALMAFHKRHTDREDIPVQEESVPDFIADTTEDTINIFSQVTLDDDVKRIINLPDDRLREFNKPLLDQVALKKHIKLIEQLFGKGMSQTDALSNDIINDVANITEYPPSGYDEALLSIAEVVSITQEVREYVDSLKQKEKTDEQNN